MTRHLRELTQSFISEHVAIGRRNAEAQEETPITQILDLEDERATRRAYERYLLQPRVPPVSFEIFALAYGKRKREERTEYELRAEYQQFRQEIARDLDPIEIECGGTPTFDEWKQAYA